MRLFFAVGSVSLLMVAATFACSSSAPATDSADAGKKDTGAAPVQETPPVEETPPVTETPPADETDGGTDEGGGGNGDGGGGGGGDTTGDAGAACAADSIREKEPNNDNATATNLNTPALTFSICGVTSGTDPDTFTFKTPKYGNQFNVTPNFPNGNVQISGTIDGQAFNGFNFGNNVNDGSVWILKVEGGGGGGGGGGGAGKAYRLTFKFDPPN